MSTTTKARPTPFTPKRPLSISTSSSTSTTTTSMPPSTTKKYKAPISSDARTRTTSKPRPLVPSLPSTPTKRSPPPDSRPKTPNTSRPKTPNTPGRRSQSPFPHLTPESEMDVSRVDVEEVLVDAENVEVGDVSADIELAMEEMKRDKEDKVLVSVRIRPSSQAPAWSLSSSSPSGQNNTIKLNPQHLKSSSTPPSFHFDSVLTGSENKPVYNAVARNHVCAAMDGYNAVVFAYGQTASGKTFTLSGTEDEPGIIPLALKDVFAYIRRTPTREYLLRCSYLEIYNETIHDLLSSTGALVEIHGSSSSSTKGKGGGETWLAPLREEVVTSLKGVKEVLERGNANRRTACTDWNERSSRSHSVFRLVVESRERDSSSSNGGGSRDGLSASGGSGSGRMTPGFRPPTPGGPRLQALGGRSVQTSVLSLIDLAGSEKATSDKERTREGKYINTSLLTLGTVISTLADNAAKNKSDYVPYRNSKLTRMLQPSLSGNARISVVCTINPDGNAVGESTSTLLFAQRIKRVHLNAQKKEIVDTEALLERYKSEIDDLRRRLEEREAEALVPVGAKSRRLSAQEQQEESKAMKDLNNRIRQLTKLILTSQSVDESKGDESRPASPVKVDFDMTPYQLQQELLSARHQLETQSTQILSLEAALLSRSPLPPDAPEDSKDRLIADQAKTIKELEFVISGYEENLGEPLRAVREDVEKEWEGKLEREVKARKEKEVWAEELVRQLERERKMRTKLEEERKALAAFVTKFDALGLGTDIPIPPPSRLKTQMLAPGGAHQIFAERQQRHKSTTPSTLALASIPDDSPVRFGVAAVEVGCQPSLLEEAWEGVGDDVSFEIGSGKGGVVVGREVLGEKENLPA
ncbi:hypothetical protein JAAARDRAFT_41369 [Jaapia argillacea MUCL 33604]|uniref:Kinesin-like protein n=1 Tax=Jaapia argillacea MUCL 33604 TaxID=933084 RepID=A0A067PJV4_9AGAM|nr:hypothetical protein JAAARDRAFT_41369 [Jaapia argillacea MUCL 33604]